MWYRTLCGKPGGGARFVIRLPHKPGPEIEMESDLPSGPA